MRGVKPEARSPVYATVNLLLCVLGQHDSSHEVGVSNARIIPEVLLDTDTRLDLFDSESEEASDFGELSKCRRQMCYPE